MENIIAKKRKCLWWFPIRFTTYTIEENHGDLELVIRSGLISRNINKIKLYRINDLTYDRSFGNFFFGVANIIVSSSDQSSRHSNCEIEKIHGAREFLKILDEHVHKERQRVNVQYTESNVIY